MMHKLYTHYTSECRCLPLNVAVSAMFAYTSKQYPQVYKKAQFW